jgi:hypothetical protein
MKNEESSLEKDYKDGTIIFEENAVGKDPNLAFRILEKMSQRIRVTDEKILHNIL